jgi:hypothetical protein
VDLLAAQQAARTLAERDHQTLARSKRRLHRLGQRWLRGNFAPTNGWNKLTPTRAARAAQQEG